jgi:hypothetical protein
MSLEYQTHAQQISLYRDYKRQNTYPEGRSGEGDFGVCFIYLTFESEGKQCIKEMICLALSKIP